MAKRMTVLGGYDLDERGAIIRDKRINTRDPGDYGCDPLGADEHGVFRFRMVPSGDVVDGAERDKRLQSRKAWLP